MALARRKVDPPEMHDFPPWMVHLWLGYAGREHGEDGLVRSAARKFACQLNSALAITRLLNASDHNPCAAWRFVVGEKSSQDDKNIHQYAHNRGRSFAAAKLASRC